MEKKNVVFSEGDLELEVNISPSENTVWLSLDQISDLFQKNKSTISRHISNIFSEHELEEAATVAKYATVQSEGSRTVTRYIAYYNLDVIISVGYRVKSQRGVIFRKWATNILRNYLIEGYAANAKRLEILNRAIQIQSNIIAGIAGIEASDVMKVIQQYSRSLELLDAYDHQCVQAPQGSDCTYILDYDQCMGLIRNMSFYNLSDVFGKEKEPGKLQGILSAIYQSAFGQDAYPTLEEKAANLLYFLVKDHPFNDGCKRIAAALFLYFLNLNKALYRDNEKIISDGALVAITLMVTESDPQEKDIMIQVIMNLLSWK